MTGFEPHQPKHGKGKQEPQYELPDAKTLEEAGELLIKDEYGKEVPFKSLYEGKGGQQLIVFTRHFFCGVSCAALTAASNTLSRTTLTTHCLRVQ